MRVASGLVGFTRRLSPLIIPPPAAPLPDAVPHVPKQLWPLIWLYTQRGGGTKQFFEMVFQFVYVPTRANLRH